MTRREKLLSDLDLEHSRGIEIGPLTTPIVTKEESHVFYVDHLSRELLQQKYASDAKVDIQKIVPVDAIWGECTLRECFPDAGEFDYLVASHVIEHVPDLVGWLQEAAQVLGPGGRLMLVIPDRRYTFDYLRQTTRLNEVIDAYLRRNRRPMPAQFFDFISNAVDVDVVDAWEERIDAQSLQPAHSLHEALGQTTASFREGDYHDVHCWVFTARSLLALLIDLVDLDLLAFRCLHFYEAERNSNEMCLVLERWHEHSSSEKEEARQSFLLYLRHIEELEAQAEEQKRRAAAQKLAEQEIAALHSKIQALESDVRALITSNSFRLTQPLRKIRAAAKRLLSPAMR